MRTSPLLAAAALTVALATPATAAAPSTAKVVLKDIAFHKSSVTIRRGGTVTWRWDDGRVGHDVTSRGTLRFKSSTTKQTGTWRIRFTKAGTYRYVCTVHPGMAGRVIVR
jgi:plastocyanin